MAGLTPHYLLQKLDKGDNFATNGQKYTTTDRDAIDRIAYVGAQGHHHDGLTPASLDPVVAPTLVLTTGVGSLPAGARIWYKYTLADASGFETAGSPEAFIDMPAAIIDPLPPSLSTSPTGGTLAAGGYFYAVSAYTGISTAETRAASAFVTAIISSTTNANTITFATLPTGATGWNIYRQHPGGSDYFFLASVNAAVATPPTSYTDTGAVAEDINRRAPSVNVTSSANSVTVTLPGATPVVPIGYTWNLYRTLVMGDYTSSLLHKVVETTTEGGTIITTTWPDVGAGTTAGSPPTVSLLLASPSQVNLSTETTGLLPPASVSSFPVVVTFSFGGAVIAQTGRSVWHSEFASARIVSARASLGRGSLAASQPVIVDVLKGSGATPTYASIYAAATPVYPQVPTGLQVGQPAIPVVTTLVAGDTLGVDVLQAGGGATPTDHDLTVNILMMVSGVGLT